MTVQGSVPQRQTAETVYTIGEAADLLGVSVPTIRLYEREGIFISRRRDSRHRRYTLADIERLRCIRNMIRNEKVSIAGIRRLLAMIPCWKIKGCPDDVRDACPAFAEHTSPCWTIAERPWECRDADCRSCAVYARVADCQTLKRTIAGFTTAPGSHGQAPEAA